MQKIMWRLHSLKLTVRTCQGCKDNESRCKESSSNHPFSGGDFLLVYREGHFSTFGCHRFLALRLVSSSDFVVFHRCLVSSCKRGWQRGFLIAMWFVVYLKRLLSLIFFRVKRPAKKQLQTCQLNISNVWCSWNFSISNPKNSKIRPW